MADRLADLVDVRLASAGVALVTLNLPQVRNAMTTELTAAWTTAMDQVAGDLVPTRRTGQKGRTE